MAKTSGGVRTLKTGSKEYNLRKLEAERMKKSGDYSEVYFSEKGGGYYAVEKSPMKHTKEELEAARFLAEKGYKVVLIDEAGSSIKVDGKIFSFTYEQRTPKEGTAENFRNALIHAKEKGADMALVYMKHNKHTIQSVKSGIKLFENNAKNKYRFKQIIVLTKDGRIHKHKHDA